MSLKEQWDKFKALPKKKKYALVGGLSLIFGGVTYLALKATKSDKNKIAVQDSGIEDNGGETEDTGAGEADVNLGFDDSPRPSKQSQLSPDYTDPANSYKPDAAYHKNNIAAINKVLSGLNSGSGRSFGGSTSNNGNYSFSGMTPSFGWGGHIGYDGVIDGRSAFGKIGSTVNQAGVDATNRGLEAASGLLGPGFGAFAGIANKISQIFTGKSLAENLNTKSIMGITNPNAAFGHPDVFGYDPTDLDNYTTDAIMNSINAYNKNRGAYTTSPTANMGAIQDALNKGIGVGTPYSNPNYGYNFGGTTSSGKGYSSHNGLSDAVSNAIGASGHGLGSGNGFGDSMGGFGSSTSSGGFGSSTSSGGFGGLGSSSHSSGGFGGHSSSSSSHGFDGGKSSGSGTNGHGGGSGH